MYQYTNQEDPTIDHILEALQSRRRRHLLVNLAQGNPRAEQIAVLDVTGYEEDLLTSLHHVDLPKLEEMGFIEWDRQSGTITRGPQFDTIEPIVDLMIRHENDLPVSIL